MKYRARLWTSLSRSIPLLDVLIYPRLRYITRRRVVSYGVRVYEIASALVYRALPNLGDRIRRKRRWFYAMVIRVHGGSSTRRRG